MSKIEKNYKGIQSVGILSEKVIKLLGLNCKPQNIFIGPTNIAHMKKEHPECFDKYFDKIPEIIAHPDYVGRHPSKGSIEFIKTYREHVLVAVRASMSGVLFVRSLYLINPKKLERYLRSGTTFKVRL